MAKVVTHVFSSYPSSFDCERTVKTTACSDPATGVTEDTNGCDFTACSHALSECTKGPQSSFVARGRSSMAPNSSSRSCSNDSVDCGMGCDFLAIVAFRAPVGPMSENDKSNHDSNVNIPARVELCKCMVHRAIYHMQCNARELRLGADSTN